MEHKITGSAKNILKLIEDSRDKLSNGKETTSVDFEFNLLVKQLNKEEFIQDTAYELKASTLQRHIYYCVKKAVKEQKGDFGFAFSTPYLNRLSLFTYGVNFITKFNKFKKG